jgi:hypothetical protein
MLCKTVDKPVLSPMFADPKLITYELVFSGATDMLERKHFSGSACNEAITVAAAKITEYNKNPNITSAYVVLSRLPDAVSSAGRNILSWTKPYGESL